MSTRSRIGIVKEDGTVSSIYNHNDGYPSYTGSILLENYKEKNKVEKLISLGDISSIKEEVDIPKGKTHSFDKPLENITVAYMRDRGEKDCNARFDNNESDYWKSDIEEWGYLFKNGEWYFTTSHGYIGKDGEYKYRKPSNRRVYKLTKENIKKYDE